MKKTFIKKLFLNKTTVANLSTASMVNVKGGLTVRFEGCHDLITGGTCETCTCDTCDTCVTCVTCVTCNTNCGQYTCQVTCDDLGNG